MKRSVTLVACLAATTALFAVTPQSYAQASSSPAYVYLSSSANGVGAINGYSADYAGRLTQIIGSPFPASVTEMALNGSWLFGVQLVSENVDYIDSFSIASNGALQQVSQIKCHQLQPVRLGRTGERFFSTIRERRCTTATLMRMARVITHTKHSASISPQAPIEFSATWTQ